MPNLGDVREDGAVWSDAWDGRFRWLYKVYCEVCNKEVLVRKDRIERTKYCGWECRRIGTQNKETLKCDTCGKSFERVPSKRKGSKHGFYFCSRECKEKAQSVDGHIAEIRPPHYNANSPTEYRKRAFRNKGAKCIHCGYDADDRMLDVDHVNSDRSNNTLENLQVLCVWCHAVKTRKNWKSYKDIVKIKKR